jgi:hypothetical protein
MTQIINQLSLDKNGIYKCVTFTAETAEDYSLKLTMKKEYREDPLFTYYEGGL